MFLAVASQQVRNEGSIGRIFIKFSVCKCKSEVEKHCSQRETNDERWNKGVATYDNRDSEFTCSRFMRKTRITLIGRWIRACETE